MTEQSLNPFPLQPEPEGEGVAVLAPVTPIGVFAELGRLLHSTDPGSLTRVLQRVADLAVTVLPELADVSVTLIEGSRAETAVFTGNLATFLDERQYEHGFGPCLDAALTGSTITVDTADPVGTYPDFAQIAAGRGVRHVLAVGLPIPQRTVGALNLYSAAEQPFSLDSTALAEAFAGYAAIAVANATLYHSAVDEARHMHER